MHVCVCVRVRVCVFVFVLVRVGVCVRIHVCVFVYNVCLQEYLCAKFRIGSLLAKAARMASLHRSKRRRASLWQGLSCRKKN